MTATVSVNGVTKSYRAVKALRGVSFELVPGRLSALVGHNGAGKTTLIKLMLGLIRADGGSIRVLGQDPASGEFSARQAGRLSARERRLRRRPDRARDDDGSRRASEADQSPLRHGGCSTASA